MTNTGFQLRQLGHEPFAMAFVQQPADDVGRDLAAFVLAGEKLREQNPLGRRRRSVALACESGSFTASRFTSVIYFARRNSDWIKNGTRPIQYRITVGFF